MKTSVIIVRDEELNEVMGVKQLIEFANDQYAVLVDIDDGDYYKDLKEKFKDGVKTLPDAIEVLIARGFTIETKEVE